MSSPRTTICGIIAILLTLGGFALYLFGPEDSHDIAGKILLGSMALSTAANSSGLLFAKDQAGTGDGSHT